MSRYHGPTDDPVRDFENYDRDLCEQEERDRDWEEYCEYRRALSRHIYADREEE